MDKIALHRGNTWNAIENSMDSINFNDESRISLGIDPQDPLDIVYEVDVVAAKPFLISHNTNERCEELFEYDKNTNDLSGKALWKLSEEEIKTCKYPGSLDGPMVLRELLEIAKKRNAKLYLDVKVPEFTISYYMNMHSEISDLCDIIKEYYDQDAVSSIFCFNPFAALMINGYLKENNMNRGIEMGMFCSEYFSYEPLNYLYHKVLHYFLNPNVMSFQKELVCDSAKHHYIEYFHDRKNHKKSYIWTIHKNNLNRYRYICRTLNLVPVIDMFDH